MLTDIVVERMIEATQPNTQLSYSRYGFIRLTKKNKNYTIRHSPSIIVCGVGNGRDSEIEAIASICQVMVEGTDLTHNIGSMKQIIDPSPYYNACYHENVATLIGDLTAEMDLDENVCSMVENVLYANINDMYVATIPDRRFGQDDDEGWYE